MFSQAAWNLFDAAAATNHFPSEVPQSSQFPGVGASIKTTGAGSINPFGPAGHGRGEGSSSRSPVRNRYIRWWAPHPWPRQARKSDSLANNVREKKPIGSSRWPADKFALGSNCKF